jgi:hypothetical protein
LSRFSISFSHARPCTKPDIDDRGSCPAADIGTDAVLPFAAGDDITLVPSGPGLDTLCQLVILSLFDRVVAGGVDARSVMNDCAAAVVRVADCCSCSCI